MAQFLFRFFFSPLCSVWNESRRRKVNEIESLLQILMEWVSEWERETGRKDASIIFHREKFILLLFVRSSSPPSCSVHLLPVVWFAVIWPYAVWPFSDSYSTENHITVIPFHFQLTQTLQCILVQAHRALTCTHVSEQGRTANSAGWSVSFSLWKSIIYIF